VRLVAASGVYFLVNSVSVAGHHRADLRQQDVPGLAGQFLLDGAALPGRRAIAGLCHLLNRVAGWQSAVLVYPVLYLVHHSYKLYLGRLEEEKKHVGAMAELHLRTIQSLALAIDARDGTTYDHLRRVQVYAREMARELG